MTKNNPAFTRIYKKYKTYGDEFIIDKDGSIFILNNNAKIIYRYVEDDELTKVYDKPYNDYFIKIKHANKSDRGLSFAIANNELNVHSEKETKRKLDVLNEVTSKKVTNIIDLSSRFISALQFSIETYEATHVQFLNEDNKFTVRLFDIRKFVQQSFDVFVYADFVFPKYKINHTVTLRAQSILKLPIDNYEVYFHDDDLVNFSSKTQELEMNIKGQEITAPLMKFYLPNNQRISLLFQPKIVQP